MRAGWIASDDVGESLGASRRAAECAILGCIGGKRAASKKVRERGEAWFWHVLALALGQTVAELQAKMSEREFREWIEFYQAYPFDDFHRYHRPAALISTSFGGGNLQERLDWLAPPANWADLDTADINTLKAFGLRG